MESDDEGLSLRFLCAGQEGPDTVETSVLHPDPSAEARPDQLNRINGMPVGITDARWPVDEDGRRYAHICTLDLATMPALAAAEPGFRAAVLFVCDPAREGGRDDGHFVHRWVMLREEEAARGVVATRGLPAQVAEEREAARPFRVETHRVPRAVFTEQRSESRRVSAIRAALLSAHGRAGRGAVHIRRGPWWPTDPFFLQIDGVFGGLNVEGSFAYVDRTSMVWYRED